MNASKQKVVNAIGILFPVALYLLSFGTAIASGEQRAHVVEIRNLQFVPAEISVKVGDTIQWINRDIVPHTATADDKSWDSKLIATGMAWELVVEPDTFTSYFCLYHPGMKASIRIEN